MRVLFLSRGIGDLGDHDHKFLKKLIETGHEVYLVTYHTKNMAERIKSLQGLKIIHKKPRSFVKFQRYFYFTRYFHFKKVLKEINPDIVHSVNVWNNCFLGALSGFHPLLVMPMGSDILLFPRKYLPVMLITKFTISRADYIIPDCEEVKKILVTEYNYPEEKMFIFPCGIELDLFHPTADGAVIRKHYGWENKKILIMTRHFEPVYGIEIFINALPEIMSSNQDVRAILIGDGFLKKEIEDLIRNHGIEDRIKLLGRIPREKMPKYLNAADIYVSSSLSDGTSVSLLEAMACGLPVVVSDVPANLEWITDGYNGYIVPKRNIKMLASKILNLLNNPSLQKLMSKRNVVIVKEKADWDRNFNRLQDIYLRLTGRDTFI